MLWRTLTDACMFNVVAHLQGKTPRHARGGTHTTNMTAIARAEIIVDAPREVAFDHFVDFSHWHVWMPAEFRPVSGPPRGLRDGDKIKVSVGPNGRVKLQLSVVRLLPHREICWGGGSRLILRGEHCFRFEDSPGSPGATSGSSKTIIRSEETLAGLLTLGPMAKRVELGAQESAEGLLARFADYLKSRQPGSAVVSPTTAS